MAEQRQQQERQQGGRRGPEPLVCEMFAGINTATTRAGVPDQQMAWCDGFMPLAPRNLRALPDLGSSIFDANTRPGNPSVAAPPFFYNIGQTAYMAVLLSNGSIVQVNTTTGAVTTILGTGAFKISTPDINHCGFTQFGQQYLIIVSTDLNGFKLWDGGLLYRAGTLGPTITLTGVGAGYVGIPNVIISGGKGTGASATAQIANGIVTSVTLTNPGTGYKVGDAPVVTFQGGQQVGSGASFTVNMSSASSGGSGGILTAVFNFASGVAFNAATPTITNPGSGYSSFAQASWTYSGAGFWSGNAQPGISLTISGGSIAAVTLVPNANNPTMIFYATDGTFPTITVSDTGNPGAFVSSITVNSQGSNYSGSTTIQITGGNAPNPAATAVPVIVGGQITAVTVQNGGVYGGTSPAPTATAVDNAVAATATVAIMPFGLSATWAQTYQGRVFCGLGATVNISAPNSPFNFATSAGGLSFQSTDSFLKVTYVAGIQSNGFLFLVGDSSMNYISNVQTSGTPPVTTFTNNNSDPETGTPFPASVTTFGQDILIANSSGIFVSSGGAFVRRSEPLDGVYGTFAPTFNGVQLSAAKATIFGKRVWMVLVPITDPVTGVTSNKLLMYNGKIWWTSGQNPANPLKFIAGQEINSTYTAFGTDGRFVFPLFAKASAFFNKTVQTKLWDSPGGYEYGKTATRFWSLWNSQIADATAITLNVDAQGIDANGNQFSNSQANVLPVPTVTGGFITPPTAIAQQGVLQGFTLVVSCSDITLISAAIQPEEPVQYRG